MGADRLPPTLRKAREEWGTLGSCDIGENQNPRFRIQARMCIPEIHRIVSPEEN